MGKPVPSPISARPPEMWSSVSAWRASMAGLRRGICVTAVEMRIALVASAMAGSRDQVSNQGRSGLVQSTKWSAKAATSTPSASSRTARAFSVAQPAFTSMRTWKRNGWPMAGG